VWGASVVRYVDFVLQLLGDPGAGSREWLLRIGISICGAAILCLAIYVVVRRRRKLGQVTPHDEDDLTPGGDGFDPAVAAFDQALAVDPLAVDKRKERGLHYFQKGQYDLAIQDLHIWVAQAPASADAYRHRGDAWRKLGFNDLAIADYRHALRLQPSHAGAREGFKALLPADGPMPAPKKVPSLARLFEAELQGKTITLKATSGERHEPQKEAR
jgi:tetratricopeptide (TPR) repeat protein